MMVRTSGTDKQGAFFSPSPLFLRQEPRGKQGECLMVMPSCPRTNLVLGHARFTFGPPQTFFDAVQRIVCNYQKRRMSITVHDRSVSYHA